MRVSSTVVLSLLAAIGIAAPAAENGASIVARDDDDSPQPAQPAQPGNPFNRGQPQLPPDSIGCGFGTMMRVYTRAQIDTLAAIGCRLPPTPFFNREGIDFGTPQNQQLFEFSIERSGINPRVDVNTYRPSLGPNTNTNTNTNPNPNPNPNPNSSPNVNNRNWNNGYGDNPSWNNRNRNNPNWNNRNWNNRNWNNRNWNNRNWNNRNWNNPNWNRPSWSRDWNNPDGNNPNTDRVIFDQRCQAVGVVTEMNPGGNPFSNNLVACKNGIFNAGGGDE